jgi:hypothetical protein
VYWPSQMFSEGRDLKGQSMQEETVWVLVLVFILKRPFYFKKSFRMTKMIMVKVNRRICFARVLIGMR